MPIFCSECLTLLSPNQTRYVENAEEKHVFISQFDTTANAFFVLDEDFYISWTDQTTKVTK